MGSSSWQRTLGPRPCPQNSKCTAEQSAGCRTPPWRERTTWRNVSGPSPSTECRTRWGRQTLTSWHTWCSRPEEERGQLFDLNKCKTRLSCLWSVCVLSWDVSGWSFYSFKKKNWQEFPVEIQDSEKEQLLPQTLRYVSCQYTITLWVVAGTWNNTVTLH